MDGFRGPELDLLLSISSLLLLVGVVERLGKLAGDLEDLEGMLTRSLLARVYFFYISCVVHHI